MLRWSEEILLVAEEMRRTVAFLRWWADWWNGQAGRRQAGGRLQNGLDAYAKRQSFQLKSLAANFCSAWHRILSINDLDVSWMT